MGEGIRVSKRLQDQSHTAAMTHKLSADRWVTELSLKPSPSNAHTTNSDQPHTFADKPAFASRLITGRDVRAGGRAGVSPEP